jgi:hypothetical protein
MKYFNSVPTFFAPFVLFALAISVDARVSTGTETTNEIDLTKGKGGLFHRRNAVSDECQSQIFDIIDSGVAFEVPSITAEMFAEDCIQDSENGVSTCDSSQMESNMELVSSCAEAGGKSVPVTFKLGFDCMPDFGDSTDMIVFKNINICGGKDCSGQEIVDVTKTVVYNLLPTDECTYDIESGGYNSQQASFYVTSTLATMAVLLISFFAC